MKNPFDILLPYQKKIVFAKSNRCIVLQSRQTGKSLCAAAKAVRYAIMNPNTLTACISTGERAAAEFLLKCRQWAEACKIFANDPSLVDYEASTTQIRFSNGSRIIILPSGNPAALRGYSGNIVLDEFAIMQNDDEVWAAIAPLVTSKMNSKDKWVLILSTPTSETNRFAKIWFDENENWHKQKVTIYDAVSEGLKADIDSLKLLINDDFIWKTEYLCEFASSESDAFDSAWLDGMSIGFAPYDPSLPAYLGGDIARTSDFTVFAILQQKNGIWNIVDLVKLHNVPFNEQMEALKRTFHKYRIASGYIDETGIGKMFAEEAGRTISTRLKPFNFTQSSKADIFERLRKVASENALRCRKIDEDYIKSDFASLKRMISKNGGISYVAPHTKTGHADGATSIALALASAHDKPVSAALPFTNYSIPTKF
jgi:phage FluMu gp28-like protein